MQLDWTSGELAEGMRCYCEEEFFAAHEHWEGVWLKLPEPEKTFLQGLIQVAAAFHHFQRGNLSGTLSLLRRALQRLERYPASFGGIGVSALCEEIREWLEEFEAGKTIRDLAFPEMRLDG
jgi:predicted metal-dependent hydrolase